MDREPQPSPIGYISNRIAAHRPEILTVIGSSLKLADSMQRQLGNELQIVPLDAAVIDEPILVPWETLAATKEAQITDETFDSYFNPDLPRQHVIRKADNGKKILMVRESVAPPFASGVHLVSFYDEPEEITVNDQQLHHIPLRHALVVHENRCVDLVKGWRTLGADEGIIRRIGLLPVGSKSPSSPLDAMQEPLKDVFFTDGQRQTGKSAEFLTATQATRQFKPAYGHDDDPLIVAASEMEWPPAALRMAHFVPLTISGEFPGKPIDPESKMFLAQLSQNEQLMEEFYQRSNTIIDRGLRKNIVGAYVGLLARLQNLGIPLEVSLDTPEGKFSVARQMFKELETHQLSASHVDISNKPSESTIHPEHEEDLPDTSHGEPSVVWDPETSEFLLQDGLTEFMNDPLNRQRIADLIAALQRDPTLESLNAIEKDSLDFASQIIPQMSPELRQQLKEQTMRLLHASDDQLSRISKHVTGTEEQLPHDTMKADLPATEIQPKSTLERARNWLRGFRKS